MAVYEVKGSDGNVTLVECRTQKSAINHVANKGYTARTLNMSEVVKHVKAGVLIETLDETGNDATTAASEGATNVTENGSEEQARSFSGRFTKKSA